MKGARGRLARILDTSRISILAVLVLLKTGFPDIGPAYDIDEL